MFIRGRSYPVQSPEGDAPPPTGGAAGGTPPAGGQTPPLPVSPAPAAPPVPAGIPLDQHNALLAKNAQMENVIQGLARVLNGGNADAKADPATIQLEMGVREVAVAQLAFGMNAHDGLAVGRLIPGSPALAVDLNTRSFKDPSAAYAAVKAYLGAPQNEWQVRRSGGDVPAAGGVTVPVPTQGIPPAPPSATPPTGSGSQGIPVTDAREQWLASPAHVQKPAAAAGLK